MRIAMFAIWELERGLDQLHLFLAPYYNMLGGRLLYSSNQIFNNITDIYAHIKQ